MTTSRIEMARKMATAPKGEIFRVSNFIHSPRAPPRPLRARFLPVGLSSPFLALLLLRFLSRPCVHAGVPREKRATGLGTPENVGYSREQVSRPCRSITRDPVTGSNRMEGETGK